MTVTSEIEFLIIYLTPSLYTRLELSATSNTHFPSNPDGHASLLYTIHPSSPDSCSDLQLCTLGNSAHSIVSVNISFQLSKNPILIVINSMIGIIFLIILYRNVPPRILPGRNTASKLSCQLGNMK